MQQGEVIFNMAASFHVEQPGPELQAVTMPEVVTVFPTYCGGAKRLPPCKS